MLIGSQLQKAQLEVVSALPTTDLAIGRIVYLKDASVAHNSGLWMYNDASEWERILDPGLYDRIVGTDTDAGTTPAAPTQDLNAVKQALVDLIDGSSTTIDDVDKKVADIIDGTNTSGGYISLLPNKTPPQEMSHTWNLNGRLVENKIYMNVDGWMCLPFDCEVTGFSASMGESGSSGATEFYITYATTVAGMASYSLFSTNGKFIGDGGAGTVMYSNHVVAATGVAQASAVNSEKTGTDVLPVLGSTATAITKGMSLDLTVVDSALGAEDLAVTLFFRRRTL